MAFDLAFARSQFPALSGASDAWVYLDNAGGSQVLGTVADRVREYLLTSSVQIGATYGVSALAAERVRAGQTAIAELINAERPDEIVFGASSTVMIRTLAQAIAPTWTAGDEVVVSMIDHEANIGPWLALESRGIVVRRWEINPDTMTLEVADLEALMTSRTRLVVCTQTSNIFGEIVPVAAIAACAHRHGAQVCVDGVAFAPHRLVDVRGWDVDYYVFSLYKVFGPHHAVLYGKYAHLLSLANLSHHFVPMDKVPGKLQPGNPNYELSYSATAIPEYLVELGRRSGAPAGASRRECMAVAWEAIAAHESLLTERLLSWLGERPGVRIIGPEFASADVRVPTVSFVVEGRSSEAIVRAVDPHRVGIRFGDFYSRRLIERLGLAPGGVVRVSFAHYNSAQDLARLTGALQW